MQAMVEGTCQFTGEDGLIAYTSCPLLVYHNDVLDNMESASDQDEVAKNRPSPNKRRLDPTTFAMPAPR